MIVSRDVRFDEDKPFFYTHDHEPQKELLHDVFPTPVFFEDVDGGDVNTRRTEPRVPDEQVETQYNNNEAAGDGQASTQSI